MIEKFLTSIFGTQHERDVKRMLPRVAQINALEPEISPLSDEELRGKTDEFRGRLRPLVEELTAAESELENEVEVKRLREVLREALDDLLPEAFAVCREAAKRSLNMRHFDVQLMGGIVLHQGKIAEMKTGEGKTLVATLPVYLNALTGRGVHVVTVNDYLARRDSDWMGRVYRFLGLTVGVIQHSMGDRERQEAYAADVTYGTNNEYGFDYLRDNMKFELGAMVQRRHVFGLVDEVDSILIDEARTPLIISGPSEESVEKYYHVDRIIPRLNAEADFQVDEKQQTAVLTEEGVGHAEKLLGVENLYDPNNMEILHAITQGVRAHALYKPDVDYMIKDGEIIIVDEFTGRLMPGRRWSDGLHQAVEAKEGVKIEAENQTLATITFQNYFRMYEKLAGMTGTADTEAAEFDKIYKLEVVVIPTNQAMIRRDEADLVYRSEREKFDAITEQIKELSETGQPALVGTVSIEKSEKLSAQLKRSGVPHVVLNAKYHEREAEIVAQAGRKNSVTIATNMAGRGTDIILGGNPDFTIAKELAADEITDPAERKEVEDRVREEWKREHEEVVAAGGLFIIGTERHESRRIDNQLRGRSGRQGDPGASRFYLSLEDDLMRIFGSERISGIMERLGMEEGVPIEHRMVTRAIERAQKQVEGRNFEIRKHLLEYDDVMNKQREAIYTLRRNILEGKEGKDYVLNAAEDIAAYLIDTHLPEDEKGWNEAELDAELFDFFGIHMSDAGVDPAEMGREAMKEDVIALVRKRYEEKEQALGAEVMALHLKYILLQVIDAQWKDHLLIIDHLKEGIGLRGYGQRDPLIEYKRESFDLFQEMMERTQDRVVKFLWKTEVVKEGEQERRQRMPEAPRQQLSYSAPPKEAAQPIKRQQAKVGRNDPCPCGSGKKYKKCHGMAA